jgi:hypothetical protein
MDLHQLPVDPRFDCNGIEGGYVAEPVQVDGDAGARDWRHNHWDGTQLGIAPAAAAPTALALLRDRLPRAENGIPRDAGYDE